MRQLGSVMISVRRMSKQSRPHAAVVIATVHFAVPTQENLRCSNKTERPCGRARERRPWCSAIRSASIFFPNNYSTTLFNYTQSALLLSFFCCTRHRAVSLKGRNRIATSKPNAAITLYERKKLNTELILVRRPFYCQKEKKINRNRRNILILKITKHKIKCFFFLLLFITPTKNLRNNKWK